MENVGDIRNVVQNAQTHREINGAIGQRQIIPWRGLSIFRSDAADVAPPPLLGRFDRHKAPNLGCDWLNISPVRAPEDKTRVEPPSVERRESMELVEGAVLVACLPLFPVHQLVVAVLLVLIPLSNSGVVELIAINSATGEIERFEGLVPSHDAPARLTSQHENAKAWL